MTANCDECQVAFGCISKGTPCFQCKAKILCSKCAGKYALIPFDPSKPNDESNDLKKNGTVQSFCKVCFQNVSVLDYSKTFEEIKNEDDLSTSSSTGINFLMVHGGGGSRAMFRPHAQIISRKQQGYRCILIDLPGHGVLADTPLTLDACVDTVKSVYEQCNLQKGNTIYVGGSLGAYIGFHVLQKLQDNFCGAVLMDCGQNVGPDCSFKARLGLWFLRLAAGNMSNKALLDAMVNVSKKSKADVKLVESVFGAGMFFDQGVEQCICLHSVDPAKLIPSYEFPILFMNGSEDHRDSEDKWLALCKDKERSSLKVYDGGDHFFMHDSRFLDDVIDRMVVFAKQVSKD